MSAIHSLGTSFFLDEAVLKAGEKALIVTTETAVPAAEAAQLRALQAGGVVAAAYLAYIGWRNYREPGAGILENGSFDGNGDFIPSKPKAVSNEPATTQYPESAKLDAGVSDAPVVSSLPEAESFQIPEATMPGLKIKPNPVLSEDTLRAIASTQEAELMALAGRCSNMGKWLEHTHSGGFSFAGLRIYASSAEEMLFCGPEKRFKPNISAAECGTIYDFLRSLIELEKLPDGVRRRVDSAQTAAALRLFILTNLCE